VTSGRRALVAAYVRSSTRLPALYSFAWADACAALVELGWSTASRSLLSLTLDPATVDQAARVLLGGMPPTPTDLTTRLRRQPHDFRAAAVLPTWATLGVHLAGETTYVHPTLDLDAAEAADARQWPPVTVAAHQSGTDPIGVLVEVGAAGPPTRFTPDQANHLSVALQRAAAIAEGAR
jgi:hypothetical protein